MAAQDPGSYARPVRPVDGRPGARSLEDLAIAQDHQAWLSRSRVMLTPIAAPSIMGLFGFVIATVMLGSWQAIAYPAGMPGVRVGQ